MKKKLYKKPVRKGKEVIFYVLRIGKSNIQIIVASEESQYWRIKERIQELVDLGSFDTHFPNRGQVFCMRATRLLKSELTDEKMKEKVAQIKRDFNAITREELSFSIFRLHG